MEKCKVKLEGEGVPTIKRSPKRLIASLVPHFENVPAPLGLTHFKALSQGYHELKHT